MTRNQLQYHADLRLHDRENRKLGIAQGELAEKIRHNKKTEVQTDNSLSLEGKRINLEGSKFAETVRHNKASETADYVSSTANAGKSLGSMFTGIASILKQSL